MRTKYEMVFNKIIVITEVWSVVISLKSAFIKFIITNSKGMQSLLI
jgi:hypothetical protein